MSAPERFERRERRYLLRDVRSLTRALDKQAVEPPAVYRVTSLYLDHPVPTWSAGRVDADKLRLRQYGSEAPWYLERKRCRAGRVHKTREPVRDVPVHLRLVATVHYRRRAYQLPGGVRVTVDDRLISQAGQLPGRVVEVKGPLPGWLRQRLPKQANRFSKSAWALGTWRPSR